MSFSSTHWLLPIVQLVCIMIIPAPCRCEPPISSSYGGQVAGPSTNYGPPSYSSSSSSSSSSGSGSNHHNYDHHDHHHNSDYDEPKAYEFGYQVKDDYTGTNYNRQESSDGNQVRGEYRVQLPDGRTQIVTYYADWQTGFHADVRYEGTAHYPDQYNTHHHGGGGGGYGGSGVPQNQNHYHGGAGGYHTAATGVGGGGASGYGGAASPYNSNHYHHHNGGGGGGGGGGPSSLAAYDSNQQHYTGDYINHGDFGHRNDRGYDYSPPHK